MRRLTDIRTVLTQALVPILGIYLLSRLLLLAIVIAVITQGFSAPVHARVDDVLCRWDCSWYLGIAEHGYSDAEQQPVALFGPGRTSFGFYPLFPLTVHALTPLAGASALWAGMLVANLALIAALCYLYLYVQQLGYGRVPGLLAVSMTCMLPQSIVYSEPFTESLSMLLLVAAMFHVRQRHYLVGGLFAALLSATRPNGVLFLLFALVWLVQSDGWRAHLTPWRYPERYLPLILAPLGMFAFLIFCYWQTGDAFAYSNSQRIGWGWAFSTPWNNLAAAPFNGGNYLLCAIASVLVLGLSTPLLRERLYAEWVFCVATIVLILSGTGVPAVFRYWLLLFPLCAVWSHRIHLRPLRLAMVFACLGLVNGTVTVAWTLGSRVLL